MSKKNWFNYRKNIEEVIAGKEASFIDLCISLSKLKVLCFSIGNHFKLVIPSMLTYVLQTKLEAANWTLCNFFVYSLVIGWCMKLLKLTFDNTKNSASCFLSLNVVKFFNL